MTHGFYMYLQIRVIGEKGKYWILARNWKFFLRIDDDQSGIMIESDIVQHRVLLNQIPQG